MGGVFPSTVETDFKTVASPAVSSLQQRLGLSSSSRLLVVCCTGLGVSHSANQATFELLGSGHASSAGLLVACPWARDAANRVAGFDIGVHLTLNAEFTNFRWGPATMSPSLFDGEGGFPRTVEDLWEHADLDEVRRECRAQLERAQHWGVDVTHLGSHLDALTLRPEFFDVYLDLALEFALPIRLPATSTEARAGFPLRELAGEAGVVCVDESVVAKSNESLTDVLAATSAAVVELTMQPATVSDELKAYAPDWRARAADWQTLASASALSSFAGFELVGYRHLRAVQRQS